MRKYIAIFVFLFSFIKSEDFIQLKKNITSLLNTTNLIVFNNTLIVGTEGGLYKYISCPNYFGEILEWIGFAIISWSFPGLLFAIWTMANLIPRAKSNHNWYKEKFKNKYPENKKAIFPFIY